MTTRCEQRNQTDDSKVEYQVFGVFKSMSKADGDDSGDKDHQWMSLEEIYEALKDRQLIDAKVKTHFESLLPAHNTAMGAIVEKARSETE